jgi:RNA polymerase sigma factor for flagellar operon FliA
MSTAAPKTFPAALWDAYRASRSTEDRNALVLRYMPLVQGCSKAMIQRLPANVQRDDLITWGAFGLIDAIRTFDPARGALFTTHANTRVHGAMLDGLRNAADRRRQALKHAKSLTEAEESLRMQLGRWPSPEETAAKLGLTPAKYRHVASGRNIYTQSLDHETNEKSRWDEKAVTLKAQVPDTHALDPGLKLEARDLLDYAVRHFKLTEAFILRFYYLEQMTMEEVGELLGRSSASVSFLLREVLKKLRTAHQRRAKSWR